MSSLITTNSIFSSIRTIAIHRQKWIFVSFFCFTLLTISWFLESPQLSRNSGWFDDAGFVLNTAKQMLNGKRLYSDLFYQYGPIPIETFVTWCKLFGNSIDSLYRFAVVLLVLRWLLLFKVLHKSGLSDSALTITLLVATFSVLSSFCSLDPILYPSFEQIITLAAVIVWQPPAQRSSRRGAALGALLGTMQAVRFGAAAGVLAGVLVLDLVCGGTTWRSFLKSTASSLAGLLAVESCLAIWFLTRYPSDIAIDALWPSFMAGHYKTAYSLADQIPHFTTLNFFVGTEIMPLVCGLLGLLGLVLVTKHKLPKSDPRLLILVATYLFYCAVYYKQVWHFYRGSWMLGLSAAPVINALPRRYMALIVILFAAALFVGLRATLPQPQVPKGELNITPSGESLVLPSDIAQSTILLVEVLHHIPSNQTHDGIMFASREPAGTIASHLYFFYNLSQPARHSMTFPGWLRPRDFRLLPETIANSKALVLYQKPDDAQPPTDACLWQAQPYPTPYCELLSKHLGKPIKSGPGTWVFPVF